MRDFRRFKFIHPLLILAFVLASCSEERESYSVKSGPIVESVYSSVSLEPKGIYQVNALIAGHIDQVFVQPGDSVHKGDVLFTIVDVQSRANSDNARLAYELAKKNYSGDINMLDDLELEQNSALLKRRNDSLNYFRSKELFDKNAITKVELESSELQYKASQNNHELIKKKIQRTRNELKAALEQAKNNYTSSLSRSSDAVIRSDIDGLVYEVYKEEGELVMTQEPLSILGSEDQFVIKMKVDEVDITRVRLGQKVYVKLEAYKNQVFEGKVSHITPKMDERTQTFSVDAEFTKAPNKLYLGLTGEGNIIVNEISNSIVIPLEYLVDGDQVEGPDGMKNLKLGVRSLNEVQVLEGLKDGELIYKPE